MTYLTYYDNITLTKKGCFFDGKNKSLKEQIESLDKLKIDEAKELYKKAINSSDEKLKKLYFDKLILRTMYVVYNYIERNGLEIFQSSQYDIDDIQSAFIELWIKKIKNGELLNVDSYSNMFTSKFYNDICTNLIGDEMPIYEQSGIPVESFVDLFYIFIELKNSGKKFDFDDLMNAFNQEKHYSIQRVPHLQEYSNLMLIFENMYNNLNFDKTEDLEVTKRKVRIYIKLFINNGEYENISDDMVAADNTEDIVDKVMYEKFIKDVDDVITDEKKKEIIYQRFGIGGDSPKLLDELSEQFGVTSDMIRQIVAKTLRNLRMSDKIKKYAK